MNEIDMIEYTIEVKARRFKVSLPKFVVDWGAVYEHALAEAYEHKLWEVTDLEAVETKEYKEYPKF